MSNCRVCGRTCSSTVGLCNSPVCTSALVEQLEQQLAALLVGISNLVRLDADISSTLDLELEMKLEAELTALREQLKGGSLLRQPGDVPKGCYCKPGRCSAPKPEWCRDATKRDAALQENGE